MRVATYAIAALVFLITPTEVRSRDLASFEKACQEIGFQPATPAYGKCVLELDRRKLDSREEALPKIDTSTQVQQQAGPPSTAPLRLAEGQAPVAQPNTEPKPPEYTTPQKSGESALTAAAYAIGARRAATPASGPLVGFYVAIKLIQVTSLSGMADMWNALGYSQKSGEINLLAADLEKGDLANEAAMEVFKASGSELQEQIEALESAGIALTQEQQEAARRAYLKIAGTAVLWVGAGFSAVKLLTSDLDIVSKVVVGASMAAEAKSAGNSTRALLDAWAAYRDFSRGGLNMKEPSKEIMTSNPRLASL